MSSPALTHAGGAASDADIPPGPQPLLLEGRSVAAEVRQKFSEEVAALKATHPVVPGLAVVRVGQDPASVGYAGRIVQGVASGGLQATVFELPAAATRSMLPGELARLNYLP